MNKITTIKQRGSDIEHNAKLIADKGLVRRVDDCFRVYADFDHANCSFNTVKRGSNAVIVCDCTELTQVTAKNNSFQCEHIVAVKSAIIAKNTEMPIFASSMKHTESKNCRSYPEKSNILKFSKPTNNSEIRNNKENNADAHEFQGFQSIDPVAKCLSDMVTGRQLAMIREFAKSAGINAENLCQSIWNLRPSELSRAAATAFIANLANNNTSTSAAMSVRQAA
jgi:hypothetical protein